MVSCGGDEPAAARAAPPRGVPVGASYGATWTDLDLGGAEASLRRHALLGSSELTLGGAHTIGLAFGAALGGTLDLRGREHAIEPGWVGSASFAERLVDGRGFAPFVLATVSFAVSSARTSSAEGDRAHLTALDLRGGVIAGKTIAGALSPYLGVRLFGGPVLWSDRGEDLTGTDRHHYQLAAGALVHAGPIDLFAEGAFLGERALGGGLGWSL